MRDFVSRMKKGATGLSLLALVMVVLSGCGTTPDVTSYTNPISGRRTDLMNPTLLESESGREMLWMNAYRDFQGQGQYRTYIEVIYGANKDNGLLDILPGRSLTIIADDQEMNFSGLGALERREDGNAIFESARYEVTPADLSRIANAAKVTVQVRGKNGLVVREFGSDNFASFRKFVEQGASSLY